MERALLRLSSGSAGLGGRYGANVDVSIPWHV